MGSCVIAFIIIVISAGAYLHRNRNNAAGSPRAAPRGTGTTPRQMPSQQRDETGPMVYFANDRHGRPDREYHFSYKRVGGTWRAYILRMPDLDSRSGGSAETHRLWDNNRPYICWDRTVTTLKDMQIISREWADSIQEYIATGKRFG